MMIMALRESYHYYKKQLNLDPNYEVRHFFLRNIYDELEKMKKLFIIMRKRLKLSAYYYAYINLGVYLWRAEDKNLKAYHYFIVRIKSIQPITWHYLTRRPAEN